MKVRPRAILEALQWINTPENLQAIHALVKKSVEEDVGVYLHSNGKCLVIIDDHREKHCHLGDWVLRNEQGVIFTWDKLTFDEVYGREDHPELHDKVFTNTEERLLRACAEGRRLQSRVKELEAVVRELRDDMKGRGTAPWTIYHFELLEKVLGEKS